MCLLEVLAHKICFTKLRLAEELATTGTILASYNLYTKLYQKINKKYFEAIYLWH